MISCIVIGAGPGGLVATKELLESGFDDVLCLEQSSALGGVFSDTYDSLTFTSSAIFSMFSDFWVGDGKENHFWSKSEALAYWSDYARHFGVMDRLRFNMPVVGVTRLGSSGWRVEMANSDVLECERLVLAIGNNRIPFFPDWSGDLSDIDCAHSKDYRNAQQYEGRNVVVVGGGESASDIALEISKVARTCWVSLRESTGWVVPRRRNDVATDISTHRGFWSLPRELGGRLSERIRANDLAQKDPVLDAVVELNRRITARHGIWGTYGTKTLALPKAIVNHGCKVVDGIAAVSDGGRCMETTGAEVLSDVDAIVFCTGYKNHVPFMPDGLQNVDPRTLYKHVFHPETGDRLAWIGWARPAFGSQFPIMEMQSRFCASVFRGAHDLPGKDVMMATAAKERKIYEDQLESSAIRVRSLVDYFRYMDDLAGILGCKPPIRRYFLTNPGLWLKLVYGPTQATQFRLTGPGQKYSQSIDILRKIPISDFNNIVKSGLAGWIGLAISNPVKCFRALFLDT